MKEKILVTGGTGYIGSHTVVELQNAGYEVVIIDNLSNSSADVVDNIEKVSGIRPAFEKLDCLDYAGLDAVFAKYKGIKAIIHFAASKAVGESVQKPLKYYRNNIVSLVNLLELMPKYDVKGIIFSSSCTVYGQPDKENLPVTEKAPIKKAESPYGNTKQINDRRDLSRRHIRFWSDGEQRYNRRDHVDRRPDQKQRQIRYQCCVSYHNLRQRRRGIRWGLPKSVK